MSSEDKERYHTMAKEKDITERHHTMAKEKDITEGKSKKDVYTETKEYHRRTEQQCE